MKTICLVTQGKLGISALELQSDLEMKSYGTAWTLAKVLVARETKEDAKKFVDKAIEKMPWLMRMQAQA